MIQPTYVNIVKTWFKLTFKKVFLGALILLIGLNALGYFMQDALMVQTIGPLCVPVFLIFYFVKYKALGFAFISFLVFTFFGDVSFLFFSDDTLVQASSVLYLLSYLFLLIMVLPHFKLFEVDKWVGTYLLVVFFIALYFLYVFYGILQAMSLNPAEVLLFGVRNLMLIVLAFISFGVFLNTQSKQSALFLTAVIFFGLAVVIRYINLYYLFDWRFELLQRVMYAIALFVMFKYVMVRRPIKKKPKAIQLNERYPSDTVLS